MLHTFSGDISTYANVTARLSNFICLVNVYNTSLATLQVLPAFDV